MSDITVSDITATLSYCPITGVFTRNGRPIGGANQKSGYLYICAAGKNRLAHRVAWFISTGAWPPGDIDHVNGVRTDNRLCNLRPVSRSENMQNQRRPRGVTATGVLGVTKSEGGYEARVFAAGKYVFRKAFATIEAASEAYLREKRIAHATCTI